MRYKIPIEIIELEDNNYHLLVKSTFESNETGWWVIDTGASKTVFDKNQVGAIKEVSNETEELHAANTNDEPLTTSLGYLKPLYFDKLHVQNLRAAFLDLSNINQLYEKAANSKICGLLGGDFLLKHKAVIDYKRRRLSLSK